MRSVSRLTSWWQARSLRFQLAAAIAAVGIFLVVLNTVLLSAFLNGYALDREGTALSTQADSLARCASDGLVVEILARRQPSNGIVQSALASNSELHALILGQSGSVLYASPMTPSLRSLLLNRLRRDVVQGQAAGKVTPAWRVQSGEIVADRRIACPSAYLEGVVSAAVVRGSFLLAEDQSVATRAWQRLITLVGIAGLVITALAMIAAFTAGRTMTRPIRAVTKTARAIAAGDVGRRVTPEGPAEITEMSDSFNTMVEEVLRQRRVERDLLANISHELASPIGLIQGYAEALADGVVDSESERTAALRAIRAETGRLKRLTADLLDLALLETGQVSMHVESVPIGELLDGVRGRVLPRAQRTGASLTVDAPSDLPALYIDGQRLEQVLLNLLNNALRYTPVGGTISMTARQSRDGLAITVSDTGAGIAAEELPRIWERFYRVEKGRERTEYEVGVGLGLSISRSTIDLMHGTISVASTPGVGTTFTIWLPLRSQAPNSSPTL